MTSQKPARSFRAVRDPLYRKILERLAGLINDEHFEECMGDLLRSDFPGLVPVPGGNDAGMDGAIADGKGEPFPLVATVGDPRRNLRKNLRSFSARGLQTRKVAFATSKGMTPTQRRGLFELAREEGFVLMQVFDQRAIADRLYHASRWRKDLLHLSGNPPALSIVPKTRRPLIALDPVGREKDLEWLRTTKGDRVLSGEPGSGKTFLLHHLMRRGWSAFFLNSTNPGEIRDALLDLEPEVVVIDDAHAEPETLTRLVQLRKETEAEFSILAATWKGGEDEVREALGGVAADRVRRLELLTRDEIVEVFRQMGLAHLDANMLRHLVNQAANKPGLAVTIATLALQGSWPEVIDGRALYRSFEVFFRRFIGDQAGDVLAALAVGGERGMPLEAVGEALRLNVPQVRRTAAGLAFAGVLTERGYGALAVQPSALRYAALREVYFPGNSIGLGLQPYLDLLSRAPNRESAVETLVAARAYRAAIPKATLYRLVQAHHTRNAWRMLADSSEEDALWVLEHYPGDVVDIAPHALETAPEATIPRLLERAEAATGSTDSQPGHPMRILADWVQELDVPSEEEMLQRRRKVARAACFYLERGGRRAVGVHAIFLALSPKLESTSIDPGTGGKLTLKWRLLPPEMFSQIEGIWGASLVVIDDLDAESWPHVAQGLWPWIYPDYASSSSDVLPEFEGAMHRFAGRVLRDLSRLARRSPGLAAGLQDLAQRLGLNLGLEQDHAFLVLFPPGPETAKDFEEQERRQLEAVRQLAAEWKGRDGADVARDVAHYEAEAERVGRNWPRKTPDFCWELAQAAEEPETWFDAFFRQSVKADLLRPFLESAIRSSRDGWQGMAEQCLAAPAYAWMAADLVSRFKEHRDDLLERALGELAKEPGHVNLLALRNEVPVAQLKLLLCSPDEEVALAAAVGEWCAEPKGSVKQEIETEWRTAILRAKSEDYPDTMRTRSERLWLGDILAADPELAFDWLRTRLQDADLPLRVRNRSQFAKAVSALDREQRSAILGELAEDKAPRGLAALLVGCDPGLYDRLLTNKLLKNRHLEPLAGGVPDEAWAEMAVRVYGAGYEPETLAKASFGEHFLRSSGVEHARKWAEAFERLASNPRPEIKEIARYGREIAEAEIAKAEKDARHRAVHGV